MGKVVDGLELLRMLRDGEKLPNKIYLKDRSYSCRWFIRLDIYIQIHLYREEKDGTTTKIRALDTNDLLKFKFIIEEDEEIDIDSIEEVKHIYIYKLPPDVEKVDDRVTMNEEKINEILRAVKQINRQMKEK